MTATTPPLRRRLAAAGLLTLTSPPAGAALLGGALAHAAAAHARRQARIRRGRHAWQAHAFQVLAAHARFTPAELKWGNPAGRYVRVLDEDWRPAAPPPPPPDLTGHPPAVRRREQAAWQRRDASTGLPVVAGRVTLAVPPRVIPNRRAFRRHWNHALGGVWRFDWDGPNARVVAERFELPPVLPLPHLDYATCPARVALGVLEDGGILEHDLDRFPHAMIGGSTTSGKTSLLRIYGYHLLAARTVQAIVLLDPKGGQFHEYSGLGWNADHCIGVCVATDTLGDDGRPSTLDRALAATTAAVRELGRRRRAAAADPDLDPAVWDADRVVLLVDEAAELLSRERKPASDDKSAWATGVRHRNSQRDQIEQDIVTVARLGAYVRVHVIAAAQSPRAEFLPGDARANLQFRLYLGAADPIELGIVFGKDLPDSPPSQPGWGVWRDSRHGADPADPYLYVKAYYLTAARVRAAVAATPAA